MKNVQRYMKNDVYMVVSGAITDTDGFMRDSPIVARTGVYTYVNPDGSIRREYRPCQEVFNDDSLDSFMGKPITIDHPKVGKVTADNAKKLVVGTVLSRGYRKMVDGTDEYVGCDIVVHEPKEIGDRRELSLGYRCDLEETAGVAPSGEPYDAIQRNIRINHLAIVTRARAGHKARLNLDGNEEICLDDNSEKKESEKMSKLKLDGVEYEVSDTVISHINALANRADAAEAKADSYKAENEKLTNEVKNHADSMKEISCKLEAKTAECDTLKADAEKAKENLEAEVAKAKQEAIEEVKERKELEENAKKAKVEKTDGLSNAEIKSAVVKAVYGESINLDGKTEGYIDGAYHMAVESMRKDSVKDQLDKAHGVDNQQPKNDSQEMTADASRRAMVERLNNAYISNERML